jgi:hypothetical protein
MRIGIVGSEGAKFTPETERKARELIRDLLVPGDTVVSGACHLGGIDVWAVEEAKKLGLAYEEYPPETLSWETGYKPRNLRIARASDIVVCITLRRLPPGYAGMRFDRCYHCGTDTHVKSGGCWTMKQARKMGKGGSLLVID